jgi:hypothetical protein
VFAVNQGNEVNVSNVDAGVLRPRVDYNAEIDRLNALANSLRPPVEGNAEIDRLNALAGQVKAESHPAFNIEKTKMELAGQIGLAHGSRSVGNLDVVRSQLAQVTEYPGINPEKTRMSMLTGKQLDDLYVPSIVQPLTGSQSSELIQPEWDNRMP